MKDYMDLDGDDESLHDRKHCRLIESPGHEHPMKHQSGAATQKPVRWAGRIWMSQPGTHCSIPGGGILVFHSKDTEEEIHHNIPTRGRQEDLREAGMGV